MLVRFAARPRVSTEGCSSSSRGSGTRSRDRASTTSFWSFRPSSYSTRPSRWTTSSRCAWLDLVSVLARMSLLHAPRAWGNSSDQSLKLVTGAAGGGSALCQGENRLLRQSKFVALGNHISRDLQQFFDSQCGENPNQLHPP